MRGLPRPRRRGGNSYPNLTDDEWIWGGTLADIQTTINHGIRWEQDQNSRLSQMLAFGRTGTLKAAEISTVVEYTRSLANLDVANGTDLAAGGKLFAETVRAAMAIRPRATRTSARPT